MWVPQCFHRTARAPRKPSISAHFGLSLVSDVSPMFTFRRTIFVFRLCHVNIAMAQAL